VLIDRHPPKGGWAEGGVDPINLYIALGGALGGLLGARLGAENTPRDCVVQVCLFLNT
jgi:uncharacterized membrane protein YfcA